jgi:hypothetical protein
MFKSMHLAVYLDRVTLDLRKKSYGPNTTGNSIFAGPANKWQRRFVTWQSICIHMTNFLTADKCCRVFADVIHGRGSGVYSTEEKYLLSWDENQFNS